MASQHNLTIDTLRNAVEGRNATSLTAFYAPEAELTIIDTNNPPSRPRSIKGAKAIGEFLEDVCARDMTHAIDDCVFNNSHIAFVERCRYADGTRVVSSNTAEIGPDGITRQTIVQAWDS